MADHSGTVDAAAGLSLRREFVGENVTLVTTGAERWAGVLTDLFIDSRGRPFAVKLDGYREWVIPWGAIVFITLEGEQRR